jgi:hypothetical protein
MEIADRLATLKATAMLSFVPQVEVG